MAGGVYAQLLGKRQVQVVVLASIVAGLSVGIPLAIVLMVEQETGNFASAAAVTSASALASAVSGPVRGRLVDTFGHTRTLPPMAALAAAALLGLVVATEAGAPVAALVALAAMAGVCTAPLLPALRPLWADLVDHPEQLHGAYALQAVLLEVFFVAGPLAAATLIAVGSPEAAVLALGGCQLAGVLAFAATPASRAWRSEPRHVGRAGAMSSPGLRTLIAGDVPFGGLFGTLDVAVPAFCAARGTGAAAGVALAALAVGSMGGGLVYGARSSAGGDLAHRYLRLVAAMAILMVPLIFVRSIPALVVAMALTGLLVAPIGTVGFRLLDRVAPAGTATEATAWVTTAYQAGLALGTAAAGPVIDHGGTTPAFAVACGFAALGTVILFAGRRRIAAHSR